MNSIQNNPFRVIGIPANASAKDIQSRKSKVQAFTRIGKEVPSEFDFPFFEKINRDETLLNKAYSSIEHNNEKILYSLFWFTKVNSFDEMALKYLENDDVEKAKEIWKKISWDKEVSASNWSAFNNISTLLLWGYDDVFTEEPFHEIINTKVKLIDSDFFNDFVLAVADQTYSVSRDRQIEIYLDTILKEIKNKGYNTSKAIRLFNNCNQQVKSYVLKGFTEDKIVQIEHEIEKVKKDRESNPKNAYQIGKNFHSKCLPLLNELKDSLGVADSNYKRLSDSIAKELLQCSIDYYNKNQESGVEGDYLPDTMLLAQMADKIAHGKMLKDRIQDNISTLEEMKDREINEAVDVLQMVKNMYEENARKIDREIEELTQNDFAFTMGYKTINWTAVEANKKNSINWQQVSILLSEVLSTPKLRKIKESSKQNLKDDFWKLLNWVKDNSSNNQISQLVQNYKNIPPKLCFDIVSAEITNTDNKPLTVEDIRYISIKIKINSKGSQTVKIYKKYINPEGKYDHNSKYAPKGYTTENTFNITPNTKVLDLGGWGSKDKCTYEVGQHKIELYVDHHLIFTKTFSVDWSPAKKAELTRNLDQLKQELKEVEKFKWFRGPETKQKEVKEVQDKITKATKILMNK